MRILVVNPNTSAAMTATIAAAARAVAAPGTVIDAVTSPMGPASIEGYYDEAFAVPGVVQAIAGGAAAGADGAVIACFDDTGLDAARSLARFPVTGICESALAVAAMVAQRISVVTTLPRSVAPLEALVRRYGMAERVRVHASGVPVLALEEAAAKVQEGLRRSVAEAIAADRSEAVVLGCAGMADLARALTAEFGLPVIDGVAAGVKMVEALVGLGLATSKVGAYAPPLAKPYLGPLSAFAPVFPTAGG